MQHRTGYARRTRFLPPRLGGMIGSDTALHAKKQKARSPFGASGLLGECRGLHETLRNSRMGGGGLITALCVGCVG